MLCFVLVYNETPLTSLWHAGRMKMQHLCLKDHHTAMQLCRYIMHVQQMRLQSDYSEMG